MEPWQRYSRRNRYLILAAVVGLIILVGVIVAHYVELAQPLTFTDREGREILIREITLGTLLTEAELTKDNPKLRQPSSYVTTDPLALRITTDPIVQQPVTLSVRLLTPAGEVVELTPSQVSFQPGTSSYCCWQIGQPGKYSFQIFRPEKVITTIPIQVRGSTRTPTPPAP